MVCALIEKRVKKRELVDFMAKIIEINTVL